MKSCMYSSTVVKMNTYDATARPKAVRPPEVRGSHSHAGIMNVYAYFYLNLVTSTCNTTMFMYIPVLVLQYLLYTC